MIVFASAPGWWSNSQPPVIAPNATPNDYAAVNQGQVKNIAKAAVAEFDANLPGGAGDVLHALVDGWATPQLTGTAATNDYAAINLGQLKAVATPFYARLIDIGYSDDYPWIDSPNQASDYRPSQ